MIVKAAKCKMCGDLIYSRARHDFRWCSCEQTFIDGGFDYVRVGGSAEEQLMDIEVDASRRDLFEDWNYSIDKYGLIKNEKNSTNI